ncbi:tetratricopeptide repeat protein [Pseudomonas gingeri]|uniref:Tetratricopeptide repeat protein n=1 Tax=Pseudomonas gingeri TaxID=117681 RepID=A0A7Y7YCH4_9PSED|nr:tetratricopeptide repeat protein [Pseudomonas gingeri]NWA04048.1 tetratricopeptide repeat protein [Pseudomonas gingeri]NWA15892.1 tetratricopeptide repeat protein [Pseudomonas gingeri]NWA56003.1 tetratricopeptide repeat protein [Pseudomonas gingeri]NWA95986.1 tetratricopeptide repeat protein [Pseudomonas gingeri]NWB00341.1 tetratricopeptide repeat protein [Pseudomonas gingeri]
MLESLEKMLAKGVDNSLLRFGLGKGYLDLGDHIKAAEHLQRCVDFDPKYSAAWKLLGKAHQAGGDTDAAKQAWERGLEAARAHGDKQAEKEMTVFLKKLEKAALKDR